MIPNRSKVGNNSKSGLIEHETIERSNDFVPFFLLTFSGHPHNAGSSSTQHPNPGRNVGRKITSKEN